MEPTQEPEVHPALETHDNRAPEIDKSYASTSSPRKHGLTFTQAPSTHRAKPQQRESRTHLPDKLREIQRDNHILVQHITDIGARPTNFAKANPYFQQSGTPATQSSAAINRKKAAEKVAQENLAFLKRLQNIKPDPAVSRKKLEQEHAKNQQLVKNIQRAKPGPPGPA